MFSREQIQAYERDCVLLVAAATACARPRCSPRAARDGTMYTWPLCHAFTVGIPASGWSLEVRSGYSAARHGQPLYATSDQCRTLDIEAFPK